MMPSSSSSLSSISSLSSSSKSSSSSLGQGWSQDWSEELGPLYDTESFMHEFSRAIIERLRKMTPAHTDEIATLIKSWFLKSTEPERDPFRAMNTEIQQFLGIPQAFSQSLTHQIKNLHVFVNHNTETLGHVSTFADPADFWTLGDMLDEIGDTGLISPVSFDRFTYAYGVQMYKIINNLQWYVDENDIVVDGEFKYL